ncbi:membrane protein insertase YidC [Paenibacillus sp. PDC88]|uniref:membrane protein insertase YidC n=1 Tax=Paenibacillus sp. PDC88 TaxID=1884375 RepID=UPI00089654D4|nr:membrane protein insertase YidC [Paenibacillus sp. PDC88]SDW70915.1 YidC/Oxa1 family membrane protein insertase [Paenibacillus sp. PDC88]
MDKSKGFPGRTLRLYGIIASVLIALLLSGCGSNVTEITSSTPGFFNHYIVFPISYVITHMAGWFQGSYGLAIIVLTIVVRLLLFPLMLRQTKSQQNMKRVMKGMQPELDALKKKYENKKDPESAQKMQQEMLELYKKHKFNPLNIGCLPILIQLPILTGVYTAIRLMPEMSSHTFLWFTLGEPDVILAIIVAAIYLLQTRISMKNMPAEQRKQFAIMGYISPIMMAFFSISAPAAIPLYWMAGGTFLIVQTLLFQKMYPMEPVEDDSLASPAPKTKGTNPA